MTNMWLNWLFINYCSLISLGICRVQAWSGHVCTKYWVTYFTERYCARYNWWTGAYDCKYWMTRQSSKLTSAQYCCGGWKHNGNEICTIHDNNVPTNASIMEAWKYADDREEISSEKYIVKRQAIICGGYLTANTAATNLTSPNYPSPYANNLRCNWTIEAPLNYVIVINITNLDLEENAACSYDYLSINLGRNSSLETNRICTNNTKELRFISRSNQAIVTFSTDGSVTKTGFSVQYHAVLNCGKGHIAQTQTATLTSPLFPSQYVNNLSCHFTIEGPANSTIVMEITYIDLEQSTDCSKDYLQLYLGDKYILATDRICRNNMKNIQYISRSNEADVIFVTDASVVKTGFSLKYHVATNVGGRLQSGLTSAILSSPSYPLQYDNNLHYHWTIEASINSRIYIQTLSIDIEENSDCSYDYLQMYMGEGNLIETGRICRYNTNDLNLITRSDKADVIFVSDGSIKKTGFSLNYKTVPQCGAYLTVQNASIQLTSPGYPSQYPNNSYCLWTIKGPIHSRIALNITYTDIQGNGDDCPFDFLQIYLGYHYILRTKRLCGNSSKGLIFISGSNEVDVIFVTDGSITKTGFSLQYISVSYCGGHLSAGTATATLSSPNYPLQYDNHLRCHWTIDVPINYRIVINITDIDLEESGDCSKDYLQIYLGMSYILETDRVCRNNNVPVNFISMSNEVHVIFITDGSVGKRGFSLQYQANAQVTILADKSYSKAGETVNLKCSIPSFLVRASWIVNNTGVILSNCPPNGPCSPTNDTARYVYSATAISISVTITSFNFTQDTFGWTCQYGNSSTVFVINPKIPVTTVQLTNTSGEPIPAIINVVRGGITNITCSTAPGGSIPRATFRWYNRSVNQSLKLIGNQSISFTLDVIKVPGQLSSAFVISYSTLTLTGDPLYQNVYILCEARDESNTENYTQSGEVQINIIYPPVVQISPNYSLYNVIEGTQNFVFTCNIIEANPLPQANSYSWLHKAILIQGQTSASYTLPNVQKTDDGEFKCTAMNDYGRGISNSLNLNVQFPPFILVQTSRYNMIENQTLNATCDVNSNPPPDEISWYPRGEGSTSSTLYFYSVSRKNKGTYSCTARNTMTPTVGWQQIGSSTSQIEVDVLYSANITEFVAKDNIYEIMENSTLELHCRVDSNPYPEISLFLGDVLKSTTQDLNELIYIATSGCLNGGKYICSATNSVMNRVKVSAEVNLKVRCHPRFDYRTNISAEYYAALEDSVTLNVSVIAYPEPTDIMWYHRATEADAWHQVLNKPFPSTGLHSNISVHLASQRDFGDYLVNMSNSLGTYEHIFHVIPGVVTQGPSAFQAGPIAGGVAAGVVVAGICIIIFIILRKRRKLRRKEGTSLELNASTNETSDGLEYVQQHVNITEERYVELAGVSMHSGDNVSTNEAIHDLEYEGLSVNMTDEPYTVLTDVSGRSDGNVRKAHDSDAVRITHIYMNQEIIEGEKVVYDNTQERK